MPNPLAVLERHMDADAFVALQEACAALEDQLDRLGEDPKEDRLVPVLEDFVSTLQSLDEIYDMMGPREARYVREWYEELAADQALCVASLDDLEDAPDWL